MESKKLFKENKMKIYQLHKYGGEWEEAYDYIIGSYLRKERAEEEMKNAKLQDEEDIQLARHCSNCPLADGWDLNNEVAKKCEKYCDKFKYVDLGDDGFDCDNYTTHWTDVHFRIEEVEVKE
jgi:hypothetical protein